LLRKAIRWLQAQELSGELPSTFPTVAGDLRPSRLAWCYGDAGIACSLHLAAEALQSKPVDQLAMQVALKMAKRRMDDSGVLDASLCHGSAGLAHIFYRLGRSRQLPELEIARQYWLHSLLESRNAERSISGFATWNAIDHRFEKRANLLNGAAGIGLVLLTQATGESGWDYPFLFA
jgi:hypothetical protein